MQCVGVPLRNLGGYAALGVETEVPFSHVPSSTPVLLENRYWQLVALLLVERHGTMSRTNGAMFFGSATRPVGRVRPMQPGFRP
ncbi:MAG: hypothetical protein ACLS3C_03405 [Oscillospiraceae bacterium]